MSVDGAELVDQGEPYAISLTFGREEIVSPKALRDVREAFFFRLRRMGLIRLHWLVEFQGDGTPHLHMLLIRRWPIMRRLFGPTGSMWPGGREPAQAGSMSSLSTICAGGSNTSESTEYGVHHYQRQMPEGWEEPGRMWGKLGDWPTRALELECDLETFFRFRRCLRSYRIADARAMVRQAKPADLKRSLRSPSLRGIVSANRVTMDRGAQRCEA